MLFSGLSAAFFWVLISISLFMLVILEMKRKAMKKFEIPFYVIGWGVPFVLMFIVAPIIDIYEYTGGGWCVLTREGEWLWSFFYGPIAVTVFIVLITVIPSLLKVVRVSFYLIFKIK